MTAEASALAERSGCQITHAAPSAIATIATSAPPAAGAASSRRGALRRPTGRTAGLVPASQPAHASAGTATPGKNQVQSTASGSRT